MTLLEVKNLSIDFAAPATTKGSGCIPVVQDISFDIKAGETLAVVGESGCGKSVTALSLLNLIPNPPGKVTKGTALFKGKNIFSLNNKELCHLRGNQIAMIFQEPMSSLNPVMTIGNQIAEPIRNHFRVTKKEALKQALLLLEKVQIPDAATRLKLYPHQLSGGMCQRVMIAIALACNPEIIIADEPTTALDVTIQAQLLCLMKKLTQEKQTALILITHNLGIVAQYADRVQVMYAGRIVEKATATELYKNPRHPYTLGLLNSVPRLDNGEKQKLIPIPGQPPNFLDLPPGCPFHPRCRFRIEKCMCQAPPFAPVTDSHETACWVNISKKDSADA